MTCFYFTVMHIRQICQWYISSLKQQSHKYYAILGKETHQLLSYYQSKLSKKATQSLADYFSMKQYFDNSENDQLIQIVSKNTRELNRIQQKQEQVENYYKYSHKS